MLSRQLLAALLFSLGVLAAPAPGHQCPAPTAQSDPTTAQTNSPSTTSSSASASSPSATSGSLESDELVRAAWYTPWKANTLPLEKVSWSKYNVMTFAFALTTNEPSVLELDAQSKQLLPEFVEQAKANGVKALLSIGGYTGSKYFSTAVGTPQNRTAFLKAIVDIATQYELDGIDFDWEFPYKPLLSCNVISKDDTANFLEFLRELKKDERGANLTLTAAVPIKPFLGIDGNPLSNVSAFAEVFDYIAIMAYDVWGPWSTDTGVGLVGPNAPQEDQCSPSPKGSAQSALDDWTEAGFPEDRIVLGVPSYGRAYSVTPSEAQKLSFATGKLTEYPEFVSIPLGQGKNLGPPPMIPAVSRYRAGMVFTTSEDSSALDILIVMARQHREWPMHSTSAAKQ
ncbi:unnamed protein product [Cyclocybe aegerita]|uniref:GH18 domain-containing protein n=1 Tax=Cyclocybe aegerita TaxID=1973307 RepID=A0A8S0XQ46_CYCAE|nr:unnamed protein product [Cyclocybe aegerita]